MLLFTATEHVYANTATCCSIYTHMSSQPGNTPVALIKSFWQVSMVAASALLVAASKSSCWKTDSLSGM